MLIQFAVIQKRDKLRYILQPPKQTDPEIAGCHV